MKGKFLDAVSSFVGPFLSSLSFPIHLAGLRICPRTRRTPEKHVRRIHLPRSSINLALASSGPSCSPSSPDAHSLAVSSRRSSSAPRIHGNPHSSRPSSSEPHQTVRTPWLRPSRPRAPSSLANGSPFRLTDARLVCIAHHSLAPPSLLPSSPSLTLPSLDSQASIISCKLPFGSISIANRFSNPFTFVASFPNFWEKASDRLCAGSVDCE